MMEHFISEIRIEKLRHLKNIRIELNQNKRMHLLLTGKNGSGKTSLLLEIKRYLQAINDERFHRVNHDYKVWIDSAKKRAESAQTEDRRYIAEKELLDYESSLRRYIDGVLVQFNCEDGIDAQYSRGEFITAFYPAERKTNIIPAGGVQDIRLNNAYKVNEESGSILLKYMVHLKTQQSYARNEGDTSNVVRIQKWFDRLEAALRVLLDDESVSLEYDYREYDFKIRQHGREPFSFNQLSDGYSSVIYIFSDLLLRMDRNWILGEDLSRYDLEGIVLIDELETHLHIELQKKILPFLTEFFPRIQFIITTHSPYILNSVTNAKAYDLENCIELENLALYSADEIAEGYFEADEYSDKLRNALERYKVLVESIDIDEEERAERAELRYWLKHAPGALAGNIRDAFEEIEKSRKQNG